MGDEGAVEVGELEERLREYETLLEIGLELAASLDVMRVFELALEKAEQLCRAETSSIWELDEESQELFFRLVRGAAATEIRHLRIPVGQGIVGSVAASGRPEAVADVSRDARWGGDPASSFVTRAILAVPLTSQGRVVGVLQLLNPVGRAGFTDDDVRRLRHFAAFVGPALENSRLYAAQKRRFVDATTALAEAIEKRDPYTGGHVRRVVAYSVLLGHELGLDEEALEDLRVAATLHDVGKIGVPDEILNKKGALDTAEFEIMQRHPLDGAEIVARIRDLRSIVPGVRSHHERLDGSGYPDGLVDPDIQLAPRIIAVADTFDAMTTSRPYRPALEPAEAAGEITRGAGLQFCPRVAAAFESLFETDRFDLASGEALVRSLFAEDAEDRGW